MCRFMRQKTSSSSLRAVCTALVVGLALVISTPANAAKSQPPLAPTVISITSGKAYKGLVAVTVRIRLGTYTTKTRPTSSEIRVGTGKCIVKGIGTSCTVKKLKLGMTVAVIAMTRNASGVSKPSAKLPYKVGGSNWVITSSTTTTSTTTLPTTSNTASASPITTTTTLPIPLTNRAKTRVLATQTQKWSTFQALRQPGASVSALSGPVFRALSASDVVFDTSTAVGVATPETRTSGSGLLVVASDGSTRDALLSGGATVSKTFAAQNGKLYVLFDTATALVTGGPTCLLAEVVTSTGLPSCVDSTLSSVNWNVTASNGPSSSPIQLDDAGNIYYSGQTSDGKTVLRRYSGGTRTDLINDSILLGTFSVVGNGDIFMTGTTTSTNSAWIRRLSAAGSLSNLSVGNQAHYIQRFADGNYYFGGMWGTSGVRRFNLSTSTFETKFWIAQVYSTSVDAYLNANDLCFGDKSSLNYAFCVASGGTSTAIFSTASGETYSLTGYAGQAGKFLVRLYPTLEKQNLSIANVTGSVAIGNRVILSGTDSNSTNRISIFDLSSKQETIIADSSNEIEVYNLTYVPSTNKVMFNGLRFSDNKFVVGEFLLD